MKRRGILLLMALVLISVLAAVAIALILNPSSSAPPAPARSLDALAEAKILFVDGDLDGAEKALRQIPGNPAKTLLGRVLLERGKGDEASRLFGEVLKEEPKNFDATRGLAVAAQRMGRAELAAIYWTRAAELRKDDPRVWRDLAFCQREKGDRLGAMTSLQQSLSLDPNQADLSNLLSELATGNLDPATSVPGPARIGTRPPDPAGLPPRPGPPDPSQNFPKPGGRPR